MKTDIVVIENEADLEAARALVTELGASDDPADAARLRAQALILQAHEAGAWPTMAASPAEIMGYLMDQFDLAPADLRPVLGKGAAARVSEILKGTKGFSLPQIRRLHARYRIPADALIGEPKGIAA
jgi:HTH-type transcriptional regulator/antitoxin HigA